MRDQALVDHVVSLLDVSISQKDLSLHYQDVRDAAGVRTVYREALLAHGFVFDGRRLGTDEVIAIAEEFLSG